MEMRTHTSIYIRSLWVVSTQFMDFRNGSVNANTPFLYSLAESVHLSEALWCVHVIQILAYVNRNAVGVTAQGHKMHLLNEFQWFAHKLAWLRCKVYDLCIWVCEWIWKMFTDLHMKLDETAGIVHPVASAIGINATGTDKVVNTNTHICRSESN